VLTPRALAQRRRVLFTMLTTLGFRYPPGREPPAGMTMQEWAGPWRVDAGPGVRPPLPGRLAVDGMKLDERA